MVLLLCLQLGIMPVNNFQMWNYYENPTYSGQKDLYMKVDFEFLIQDIFFIGGEFNNTFWMRGIKSFAATGIEFTFKTGFTFKGFTLGFNHFCRHPITPYLNNEIINVKNEGAFEQIYLEYSGKFKLF
jgi:hypothetical protein